MTESVVDELAAGEFERDGALDVVGVIPVALDVPLNHVLDVGAIEIGAA